VIDVYSVIDILYTIKCQRWEIYNKSVKIGIEFRLKNVKIGTEFRNKSVKIGIEFRQKNVKFGTERPTTSPPSA